MSGASVVSLAERLKQRREELGMSQSQAARELDVARTAYRLWELEAAKPAPDRWRLIASWLGVSVTTMLLAEDLVTEDEAALGDIAAFDFGMPARAVRGAGEEGFFAQARNLIAAGIERGVITTEHAQDLTFLVERIETESSQMETSGWEATEFRKALQANETAPRAAREALSFVGADLSAESLETARLLVSELVTNSVVHGPPGASRSIGLFVGVERNILRVEVSDDSPHGAIPKAPSEDGGFGLTLVAAMSSRWGSGRSDGLNVTWFELDVPLPGATLGD